MVGAHAEGVDSVILSVGDRFDLDFAHARFQRHVVALALRREVECGQPHDAQSAQPRALCAVPQDGDRVAALADAVRRGHGDRDDLVARSSRDLPAGAGRRAVFGRDAEPAAGRAGGLGTNGDQPRPGVGLGGVVEGVGIEGRLQLRALQRETGQRGVLQLAQPGGVRCAYLDPDRQRLADLPVQALLRPEVGHPVHMARAQLGRPRRQRMSVHPENERGWSS